MTVPTRRLGRSNLHVSALGLGCWAIGGATRHPPAHRDRHQARLRPPRPDRVPGPAAA